MMSDPSKDTGADKQSSYYSSAMAASRSGSEADIEYGNMIVAKTVTVLKTDEMI
jgi:hypothetical protein